MANLLYVDNSNVWIEGMHPHEARPHYVGAAREAL